MKTEQILNLFDDLLCAGSDNSNICVIPQSIQHTTLGKYFGITGNNSQDYVKRGVYVYDCNISRTTIVERASAVYESDTVRIYFFDF
jgi:hypothetical protein